MTIALEGPSEFKPITKPVLSLTIVDRTRRRSVKPFEADKVSVTPVSIRYDTWRA